MSWTSGSSKYLSETHNGKTYAVLEGSSIAQLEHCFAVRMDKSSNKEYYTNLSTKEKSWELPDLKSTMPTNNDAVTSSTPQQQPSTNGGGPTFRDRVEAFYRTYNPSKIGAVDRVLKQYEGNEESCIEALIQKYGPEPLSAQQPAVVQQIPGKKESSTAIVEGGAAKGDEEPTAATAAPVPTPPPAPAAAVTNASITSATSQPTVEAATPPTPSTGSAPASPGGVPPLHRSASIAENSSAGFSRSNSKVHGSPSRHVVTAALAEFENRENTLTSYLQDREARLAEAHQRHDNALATIDTLRQSNASLIADMERLKRENDRLVNQSMLEADRLREESHIAKNEWHRERQQLEAAAEDAAANAVKALQQERLKQGELNVKYVGERAQLQTELKSARDELRDLRENSSNLLSVLERREEEHRRLLKQVDDLKESLQGSKLTRETQTEPVTFSDYTAAQSGDGESRSAVKRGAHSPGSAATSSPAAAKESSPSTQRTLERTMHAMEEFDRVMAVERFRRGEVDQLRLRCAELERELQDATDTSLSRIARSGGAGGANADLVEKLKQYRATIGALRNSNRALEDRIVALEKKCSILSQQQQSPSAAVGVSGAPSPVKGGILTTPRLNGGEVDVARLRQTVKQLGAQLEEAKKTVKDQRREMLELRARLTSFMAAPQKSVR